MRSHELASCLHKGLVGALPAHSGAAGTSTLALLQLLSTTKAALRCLELAAASGLQLETGSIKSRVHTFVQGLLCTWQPSGAHANAPDCTALQLLWRLVVQHSTLSCVAARKACDILLWTLAPPMPDLQRTLIKPLAAACSAAELAAKLTAACSRPGAARNDKESLLLHRQSRAEAIFSWVSAGSLERCSKGMRVSRMVAASGAFVKPGWLCQPEHLR